MTIYIFVLAGGLKSPNHVNDFVSKRLDMTFQLYQKHQHDGCKIICSGGGTYHKATIVDSNNIIIYESNVCAKYLIEKGVKEEDIYREWSSYDTIANGYFSYLQFIGPLKIKKYYLVTSMFHMSRSKELFNYFDTIFKTNCDITFIETENYNIDKHTLKIRQSREKNTLEHYKTNLFNKMNNLSKFSIWFYTQHDNYKSIPKYSSNIKNIDTY
tara:strand:- start:30 stop:668 length:639 start_codon:yes stop_codon:yes gene_type:complete